MRSTNTIQLRDYQRTAIDAAKELLSDNPILVAPCGAGKSLMGATLVRELGVPALWLAHRKELIDQAAKELRAQGLSTGIIMSGYERSASAQVQVASVQTLVRRDMPKAELIVIDECHRSPADTYQTILQNYPFTPRLGLTATPFRLDGRGLGELFGEIIVAAYTDELCEAGVLHRPKVWASKSPDLRGLKVVAGDYNLKGLSERTNTEELNADIVKTWLKHAQGRRTVVFAVDIAHSQAITQAFQGAGIAAEHIDGGTPGEERDAILDRLREGKTKIVSNCMILTEGWDLPALECAIIARPTASLNLHIQCIGRVMRACPGKNGATVLDHTGNHHVHGLITRRLNYTLGNEKVGHAEPLGLRRCRGCGLFFEINSFACPECGWTPSADDIQRERPDIHGAGELREFDDASFEYRREVWNLIEAERQAMGYKPGWSYYRFQERFGVKAAVLDGELIDTQNATLEQKRDLFERLSNYARQHGFKPGWASHRYRDLFGCWPRGFVNEVRSIGRLREKLHSERITA